MKTINEITVLLLVAVLLLIATWLMAPDVPDLIESHKQETIAAAKIAAHEKAVRLREAGLLDEANRMMWPIAQATVK